MQKEALRGLLLRKREDAFLICWDYLITGKKVLVSISQDHLLTASH